ncbi:MAG: hypothetical protein KA314_28305 [Chloroflexi bacterium]|nr:hypothetical protein [Chloroflexota bacterium]
MKTYRNLYPQISTFSNLLVAFYKARQGKRGKFGVAAFEYELERELLARSGLPSAVFRAGSDRACCGAVVTPATECKP